MIREIAEAYQGPVLEADPASAETLSCRPHLRLACRPAPICLEV